MNDKIEILATKVMGWVMCYPDYAPSYWGDIEFHDYEAPKNWNPYESIADAWMIRDKLKEKYAFLIQDNGVEVSVLIVERGKVLNDGDIVGIEIKHPDYKEAICEAALKVME